MRDLGNSDEERWDGMEDEGDCVSWMDLFVSIPLYFPGSTRKEGIIER